MLLAQEFDGCSASFEDRLPRLLRDWLCDALLRVEHPARSGLEPGQRAVRELVDRVHERQDRAIMPHHDRALVL